jgi:glycosyltransferase involved in cell wall biosynthesis
MFAKLKMEYGGHKQIDFVGDLLESSMGLYKTHHCFVSPHLSEGFGLMPLEAMATGMPVIMARCSAPREYFAAKYGWWVEMSEDYAPVEQCLPNTSGFWRLPDIDSLAASMREAYKRRDESRKRGDAASEYVLNNLTWGHTASQMKELLVEEGICDNAGIQRGKVVAIRSKEHRAAR